MRSAVASQRPTPLCGATPARSRGRESGRSGFGALKQRPARDPATAPLPTHTSRFPPTHPETSHNYARRPKAAASAADASRSRWWAAETSLQRQLPRAHYASSAPPLPPAPRGHPAALRRTRRHRSTMRAVTWPASSAVALRSRWWASDIALWRRACEHSPVPLRALPARTPCERYLNLSSKLAGGSQLPPPSLLGGGAAAPSSVVSL